jgi:hypothetical protein
MFLGVWTDCAFLLHPRVDNRRFVAGVILEGKKRSNEAEHLTFIFKTEVKKAWDLTSTVPLVFHVAVRKHICLYLYYNSIILLVNLDGTVRNLSSGEMGRCRG